MIVLDTAELDWSQEKALMLRSILYAHQPSMQLIRGIENFSGAFSAESLYTVAHKILA
jgi:hypothetical protein